MTTSIIVTATRTLPATVGRSVGRNVVTAPSAKIQARIGERDPRITEWSVDGDRVVISVTGPDAPAPADPLATSLAEAFGGPVTVEITYVPAVREQATSAP